MEKFDLGVVSVVPSPYQRDIFHAIAQREEINLSVYYLERCTPDSPWPEEALAVYEQVLPGFWFSLANARFHVVTKCPPLHRHQFVVLNTLTSSLSQYLLRFCRNTQRLLFWAEPLRQQSSKVRAVIQQQLSAPIRNADAIIAIGSRAVASYQQSFPAIPCSNIPYHCDLQPFMDRAPDFASAGNEIVFLFCGQIIARKGVDILVAAFDRLIGKGHRARLVLVGRQADLDWAMTFSSKKSREFIEYQGFSDPKDLPRLFSKAQVFVLPSRYDGWGVVVNQALGAGLPIICSDAVGAAFDLVQDGINGSRVAAGSIEALAGAMELFLKQPELLSKFGAASRSLAEDWTPARGAEKWVSVLQQFASRG